MFGVFGKDEYEVIVVENGKEVLECVVGGEFDVVLMDV